MYLAKRLPFSGSDRQESPRLLTYIAFYEINSGAIYIDGTNTKDYKPASLRSEIADSFKMFSFCPLLFLNNITQNTSITERNGYCCS
jgi:ABC-type multidrug transport system fused ATPase/permease subunit